MLATFIAGSIATLTVDSERKAQNTVEAMLATYESSKSYSDTGNLTCGDSQISFITRFKRPGKFYFEFTSKNYIEGRHVLWCPGLTDAKSSGGRYMKTFTWDSINRTIERNTLGLQVAGFTGISLRTACTVSNMILPKEIGATQFAGIVDMKLEKPDTIRGIACDVVFSEKSQTRLWIGHKSHILMRTWLKLNDKSLITE